MSLLRVPLELFEFVTVKVVLQGVKSLVKC